MKGGMGRPSDIRGMPVSPRDTFFIPGTSVVFITPRLVGATRSSSSETGISVVVRFPCFRASTRRMSFVMVIRSNCFFRRNTLTSAGITVPAMKKRPMKHPNGFCPAPPRDISGSNKGSARSRAKWQWISEQKELRNDQREHRET